MDSRIKVIKQVRNPKTSVTVPLIDIASLAKLARKAQKTKPVLGMVAENAIGKVKNLVSLNAIEGYESMRPGSWIVKGEIGEPWFQDSKKLFKAYTPEFTDDEGWTKFNPNMETWRWSTLVQSQNGFASHALWGAIKDGTFADGVDRYIQFSSGPAAYVLHNPDDVNDFWLVVPALYLATYAWL